MKVAFVLCQRPAETPEGLAWQLTEAEAAVLQLWDAGIAAVCPELNRILLAADRPDEEWIEGNLSILARCQLLVLMPAWETSPMAPRAIKLAESRIIQVMSLRYAVERERYERARTANLI